MNINFGDRAKDTVTGFTGICIATAFYSTGCNQALIQPELTSDGAWQEARWFDFERVQVVERAAMVIETSPTGGPRGSDAAPVR